MAVVVKTIAVMGVVVVVMVVVVMVVMVVMVATMMLTHPKHVSLSFDFGLKLED